MCSIYCCKIPCGSRKPMVARLSAALFRFGADCGGKEVLALGSAAKIGGCEPKGLLCLGFVFEEEELKVGDPFGTKDGGIADLAVVIGGTVVDLGVEDGLELGIFGTRGIDGEVSRSIPLLALSLPIG